MGIKITEIISVECEVCGIKNEWSIPFGNITTIYINNNFSFIDGIGEDGIVISLPTVEVEGVKPPCRSQYEPLLCESCMERFKKLVNQFFQNKDD